MMTSYTTTTTTNESEDSASIVVPKENGGEIDKPEEPSTKPSEGVHGEAESWDAPVQPLSTLFECQIISSPNSCHSEEESEENESNDDEGEGIVDLRNTPKDEFDGAEEEKEVKAISDSEEKGDDNASCCSMSNSVLGLKMFEGEFPEEDEEGKQVTDDDSSKRTCEESNSSPTEDQEDKSHMGPPPPKKIKTAVAPACHQGIKVKVASPKYPKKTGPGYKLKVPPPPKYSKKTGPGYRRPNCLFVNYLGTRLDAEGRVKKPATSVKTYSSESVGDSTSDRTSNQERAASSKKSTDVPDASPVSTARGLLSPRNSIPSEVHIVTPASTKPVRNSLHSVSEANDHEAPSPHRSMDHEALAPPHLMPGLIPVNFNRPFPLLQRRAFLNGYHHHGMHPQMFGHPRMPCGMVPHGVPFAPHLHGMYPQLPPSHEPSHESSEEPEPWEE